MAAHLTSSYLVAEALSATGLKNRAMLFSMDPYVKLTALPSQRSARCRKHAGGGRNPRWGGERGRLQLALAPADDKILVEVWNQNVMTPADRVGRCELSVAAITAEPQPFQLLLDTGGELAISARVADGAPSVPRAGGHTLGGAAADADRRGAAAAAAERRASDWRQGGGGGQQQNARLAARRQKDELVGKITALYAARGDDPPFGLASSDLATLRRHLDRMRDRTNSKHIYSPSFFSFFGDPKHLLASAAAPSAIRGSESTLRELMLLPDITVSSSATVVST